MSEEEKQEFDLNKHTARLLMNEPFFAGLSRRVDKRKTTEIPTAGVTVDPKTAQFVLMYNADYFSKLTDTQKLGVLKHEFYHLVFEHVTGRKPEGGLTKTDNMCIRSIILKMRLLRSVSRKQLKKLLKKQTSLALGEVSLLSVVRRLWTGLRFVSTGKRLSVIL
jgi:hypothetical protein